MQRVKTPTATAANPGYTATGTPGYFKSGDPLQGIPATVPGAEWFNMVQEELVKAVLAGGLSLSPTNDGQLGSIITSLLGSLALKAPLAGPAFTGNPTAPTPPLFDDDTSVSTTAFTQRALGNDAGAVSLTAATTLDYSYLGKVIQCAGSSYPVTLPSAAGAARGSKLLPLGFGSGPYTLTPAGGEDIITPVNGTLATLALGQGETVVLESFGGAHWYIVGGSAALKWAAGFGALLAPNGYRFLPSGEMEVWGYGTTNAAGKASVTFARAFAAEVYAPMASLNSPGLTRNSLTVANATATGMDIYACDGSGAALVGAMVFYRAKGK